MADYQISLGVDLKVGDIRSKISKYNGNKNKPKIHLDVKLNKSGISEQITKLRPKTPVLLDVRLNQQSLTTQLNNLRTNPVDINIRLDDQDALNRINNIRQQLQALNGMVINLNGGNGNGGRGIGNAADAEQRALRGVYNLYKQIEGMELKLGKLNMSGVDSNNITRYQNQLNQLRQTYESLLAALSGQSGAVNLDNVFAQLDLARTSVAELSSLVDNARTKLASDIKIKIDNGSLQAEITNITQKFNQLGIQNQQVTDDIADLQALLCSMDSSNDIESVIGDYQEFLQLLKSVSNGVDDLQAQINDLSRPEIISASREAAMQRLNGLFEEGSRAAEVFGARAEELRNELNNVGSVKGIDIVNKKIKNLGTEVKNSNLQTKTIGTRLKEQLSRYSQYISIASVFMYATQAMRSMFEQVKLIDSAMTELKKVTNETDESYSQFLNNAASRAKELGTTIDGLVSSTADFARLGYSFEESQGLAEVANIYAVVGDEIDGVEDATQSLVSTLAAFRHEIGDMSNDDFAMSIVDKMNEVSNNYAISSGGIGEALQRSASSMAAANNTLDETIALITAANEVAQNPEKVGNAFKTMSMRIRGAKTELEEAGESTEGMAESTASLREEMLALSGVDIMLNENTFKSTYQIMDELSHKWEDLSDIAQATIIELVAGKHQGNVFSSLMANFDTARAALDTSINSSGSAMAEHAKWSESLEARLNRLKAAWQSLSQTFMKSDLLKGIIDAAIGFIDILDVIIDKIGLLPTVLTAFVGFKSIKTIIKGGGLKEFGSILEVLKGAFPSVASGIGKLITHLREVSFAAGGAGSAIGGFFSTIMLHPYITAAVVAVSALTTAFIHQKNKAKELAEEVDGLVSKFKEQQTELVKSKSSFKSEAARYAQLSKGVDEFGRNISLTTDEYSEYQDVTNSIASQIPTLISGYDSQGNAILNLRDNAEELVGTYEKLVKAYEDLIEAENNKVLGKSKDIQKDFENSVKDANSSDDGLFDVKLSAKAAKAYKEMLKAEDIDSFFKNAQSNQEYWSSGIRLMGKDIKAMADLFEENGIERNGNWLYPETDAEYVKRVFKENKNVALRVINDFYTGIESETEGMKSLAAATISNAFDLSDSDFYGMNDTLKSTAKQIVNNFDYDFFSELTEKGISVEEYVNDMLKQLNALNNSDVESIEAAFNLQTKFNSGDVSYGEFIHGLEDAGKLVDTLKLSDDLKSQIKLSLGLNDNGLVEEYETLIKRITTTNKDEISKGNIIGLGIEEAKRFIDSLSAEELSVVTDIIPELDANATAQQIQAAIDREMAVRGLTFSLNLEVEAAGIEAINTALTESISASGLSSESIAALKGRYKDLESDGYNLSEMFEQTSNGIHLNRNAVRELEKAYAKQKQNDIKDDVNALKKEYDLLTEELEGCNDASERASKYIQRDAILQQINDAAMLAAQYDGLTSAYNEWLAAEEAGQERDMYENVIKGLEGIDDEISRGWLDDGTIEFLELLTGKDLTTAPIEDVKKAYKDLGAEIGKSGYSIRDFFTVNEDGESTNTGVYNFLETIESLGGNFKRAIQKNKDGNIVGFNFKVAGGDEAIAKALGVSEEIVKIMLRAADDAGFVVNLEGAWTQLANLKNEAETARDTLISLKKDGLDALNGIDVNFDLNANGKDLVTEQEKAVNLLEKFKKNGKIDLSMKGAKEALDIAEYLTIRLDDATEPRYMNVDASTLDEDLQEPLEKMQEFERLSKEKHLLTLTGDISGIENVNKEMSKIVEYLDGIEDDDTKLKLGIDPDWTREQIAKALENGEIDIPAELNLDVQMSDDLRDMRLMMMNQLGLVSDNEVKLKVGYDVDDDVVNKLTEEEKEVMVKYLADGGDVEKFDEWLEKNKNIQIIAETLGIEDVDDLASKLENIDSKTVQAIAEAIGKGDVTLLDEAIKGLDGNVVQAIAEALGYSDVEALKTAIGSMEGTTVDAVVNTDGQSEKIETLQSSIWGLEGKTIDVVVNFIKSGWNAVQKWINGYQTNGEGGSIVNGTANVNGTTGRAFKQGSWGTKNSGTALVGELGRETLVRGGKYYTVGDAGAEFIKYQRGDIIFNHRQTEELFKNGKVTSGGGRAKALADGTAFINGTAFRFGSSGLGGIGKDIYAVAIDGSSGTAYASSGEGGTGKVPPKPKGSDGGNKEAENEFEETIDWIETAIARIEREIDRLDKTVNNTYKSWSERNSSLTSEIGEVGDEIALQQKAYDRYIKEANSVGLAEGYASKVRDGTIDIEKITDEDLKKKIDEYRQWFEKAIACKDAIQDLKQTESELYAQRFEHIQSEYDAILQGYEHTETMLNEYISKAEEQGYIVSKKYYEALIDNEKSNIDELEREQADLINARDEAVASGKIAENSEEWHNMCAEIDSVTQAIEESTTALFEFDNAIRDIDWQIFDLIQERISDVTAEADFLIELMSNKKLFDDDGKLTSQGLATMALYGQNYNTHMYQADEYGAEVVNLNKQIAEDPYDQELINRRNKLLELQRESILAAEEEKNSIRDMVEDGINLELDALQERIDKYNESIDAAKDLYDYQKNVKEQSEEIMSLEKQRAAYLGNDSEEGKAKLQEIEVSLKEAKENLQETEYERYISDQQALLDTLYSEYELILNQRLDNVDALLEQAIESINVAASADGAIATALGSEGAIAIAVSNNATSVKETLTSEANKVGTTLSTAMNSIWSSGEGNAKSVLTMYGEDFKTKSTTIITTLNGIKTSVNSMVSSINKEATTKTTANKTTTSAKKNPTTTSSSSTSSKYSSSGGDGNPKIGDKVKFVSGQYYNDSQGTAPTGSSKRGEYVYITNVNKKSWATHPYHIASDKNGKHPLGWLKLNQISGYATGKQKFLDDETAWTQEGRKREFIVRPSDGAILTPIAKGDSVLNATASGNIWNMANSPAEFIRDNLNLGSTTVPNNSVAHSNYTQHLDNVVFNFPNVKNYDDMLSAMQKDKNFERLILSMSIDRIAGKSSLAKGKSIR